MILISDQSNQIEISQKKRRLHHFTFTENMANQE